MKHYTDTIPLDLAEKLKEKGMPTPKQILFNFIPSYENEKEEYTYGFVFDWLMSEKNIYIGVEPFAVIKEDVATWSWSWYIDQLGEPYIEDDCFLDTWHEAANAAIEKALEIIKED